MCDAVIVRMFPKIKALRAGPPWKPTNRREPSMSRTTQNKREDTGALRRSTRGEFHSIRLGSRKTAVNIKK